MSVQCNSTTKTILQVLERPYCMAFSIQLKSKKSLAFAHARGTPQF